MPLSLLLCCKLVWQFNFYHNQSRIKYQEACRCMWIVWTDALFSGARGERVLARTRKPKGVLDNGRWTGTGNTCCCKLLWMNAWCAVVHHKLYFQTENAKNAMVMGSQSFIRRTLENTEVKATLCEWARMQFSGNQSEESRTQPWKLLFPSNKCPQAQKEEMKVVDEMFRQINFGRPSTSVWMYSFSKLSQVQLWAQTSVRP